MPNRFHSLLKGVARDLDASYSEAREHALERDPQRAGHVGEATWATVLEQWGPGWPVVTRKYVVGPGGESNEVDVLLLKPDYPANLATESSILISGVAAAFSSKLTFRRHHIVEAIAQKKRLLEVAGRPSGDVESVLSGPFPFGLLSHSTEIHPRATDLPQRIQELYEVTVHDARPSSVNKPSEELDAILIADRAFLSMRRASLAPDATGSSGATWTPVSSLNKYSDNAQPGAPLAQFITWLHARLSPTGNSALRSLEPMFGADSASGYMKRWPLTIYPEHLRKDARHLVNQFGNPLVY